MNALRRTKLLSKRLGYIVFTFTSTTLLMLTWSGVASAARNDWCSNSPSYTLPPNPGNFPSGGRNGCIGYFTGDDVYDPTSDFMRGGNVLYSTTGSVAPAILAINAGQFIKQMEDYLNEGSPTKYTWNAAGAAFIIDNMLGEPGGSLCGSGRCTWSDGIRYAENNLTAGKNWVQLVRDYEAAGAIDWSVSTFLPKGMKDSQHACIGQVGVYCADDALRAANPLWDMRDIAFRRNNVSSTGDLIVFHNPNGSVFRIRRDCGNVVGAVQALAPITVNVACNGFTITPATVDPRRSFTITAKLKYTPASATAAAFPANHMDVSLISPSGTTVKSTSTTTPTITGSNVSATLAVPATNTSGVFTINWDVTGPIPPSQSCTGTIDVADMPYFTASGGDVAAGPGFNAAGSGCTADGSADITAFNLNNDPSLNDGYFGAGSSLGAFAGGDITGFATDATDATGGVIKAFSTNGIASGGDSKPSALAFANTSANAPNGLYGGSYGRTGGWCVADYAGKALAASPGAAPATINLSGLPQGLTTYKLPANAVIYNTGTLSLAWGTPIKVSGQLPAGANLTLVSTGDVYIRQSLNPYGSYTGYDPLDIPQFMLATQGGNMYIGPAVTALYGLYASQPDVGVSVPTVGDGGNLYTCADPNAFKYLTGKATSDSNATVVANAYDQCINPLKFVGAVAAGKLKLGRTAGSLVDSSNPSGNDPAEQFVYTPELWLGNLTGPSCQQDSTNAGCLYQAYTSLPPVF